MAQNRQDIIRVEEEYYILATSALADDRTRVLKHNETFAVFDRYGDIQPVGVGEQGLYREGTRFLSSLELRCWGSRPLLLSSLVKEDNSLLSVDFANPDISIDHTIAIPRENVHLVRFIFLWGNSCFVRVWVRNYAGKSVEVPLSFHFEADFRDIFEVRGMSRKMRGEMLEPVLTENTVTLQYQGLDGIIRRTIIESTPAPRLITPSSLNVSLRIKPGGEGNWYTTTTCQFGDVEQKSVNFSFAKAQSENALARQRISMTELRSSNEHFNRWARRSWSDLMMMTSITEFGPYPYAGIPWYCTPFGRDGLITAMELLWAYPSMAKGVLSFLAANQASEHDPARDAEPGKIVHEMRTDEMANLGEVPFGKYYGTVDATALFVMLVGMYYERTADKDFVISMWPHVERALAWMDTYGDYDNDGFIEYYKQSESGLVQQGWKDSHNSIFHADGSDAEGPIALCEVQGYSYAARVHAGRLAALMNNAAVADDLLQRARDLRNKFEKQFWCEDLGCYALALDGKKRPCKVVTSNAGHALFTGIANKARARRLAHTLLSSVIFSGWGIRTVASNAKRFNPMSYHNGTVWPHDNALIAYGLARYGMKNEVLKIFAALLDVSQSVELYRMPELFCGFARRKEEGLTTYPLACEPQAWAAGSLYMSLQAALGMTINALQGRVTFYRPVLPPSVRELEIRNLSVGEATVDLRIVRHQTDVGVNVLRRSGAVDILVVN